MCWNWVVVALLWCLTWSRYRAWRVLFGLTLQTFSCSTTQSHKHPPNWSAYSTVCIFPKNNAVKVHKVLGDEESLPFAKHSFDLVISNLSLHWVNDLPGVFRQVQQVLKPDGLFLASMFGEATLWELRNAFLVGEQEREGGISNHVSPFAGVADIGDLLTRARFGLPTVDQESIVVDFKDPFVLMKELRLMGESNAQLSRRPYVPRDTFYAAAAAYKALYGKPNGGVPATFQIVYLIGWSPHPSQQQALSPGSAKASMKEFSQQVGEFKTL
ncbi:NDUF5 hydroxylase [Balamuthia mandrillaris]